MTTKKEHVVVGLLPPAEFQRAVLDWYNNYGRKNLPWQKNLTPYRVWLSEIMLQQTQVTTVIPYFERFTAIFPTVEKLAKAPLDEVMHLWTGLGYYSRARNLHKTANIIVNEYQREFPADLLLLQSLPGVGRSTAGAILSTAFNQPATVLDGNVKRVLSRYVGVTEWLGNKTVENRLWILAESYTPIKKCREYTQVMMDLGATVCTRSKPNCQSCPLKKTCVAFASGDPSQFPGKKVKKTLPVKQGYLLILQQQDGSILLEKRPPVGIWGGLWCLPDYPVQDNKRLATEIKKLCQDRFGLLAKNVEYLATFRHTFSHFHYDITPIRIAVQRAPNQIRDSALQLWYDPHHPPKVGLAQPVKRLLLAGANFA